MPSAVPQHLTGPQHYTEGERLLALAEDQRAMPGGGSERANATATLALGHLTAARLSWDVAAALFDSNTAADWDEAEQIAGNAGNGMLTGWPEAIR